MSNVLARKRQVTELAFYVSGQQLQTEITKFAMNEKAIPKKYRLLLGQDIIKKTDELMDNIIAANSIYPTTEDEMKMRKAYQTRAINNCFQIQNRLIRLVNCISIEKRRIAPIADILQKEVSLLKNWKKSAKIQTAE
ncbi:MAG: hypothetical protein IJ545_06825 [Alphaproteobacteria bacterium]|nr:hypothetical protein [Alphaproteobacteria bacterium]